MTSVTLSTMPPMPTTPHAVHIPPAPDGPWCSPEMYANTVCIACALLVGLCALAIYLDDKRRN